MKFIIGSTSVSKIETARKVLSQYFSGNIEVSGCPVTSGVPDTPYDKQTFAGAKNRALGAKTTQPEAAGWLGVESGLIERYGHMFEEAWACLLMKNGEEYLGYSSGLKLPDYVISEMDRLGLEHCDVMKILEDKNGKLPNDTWGSYSGGVIVREQSLEEAIRNAAVQATAPAHSLYKTGKLD